jgi:chemotaxis protein MotB
VSKNAYKSAIDKNADLNLELAQQRQQLAQRQEDLVDLQKTLVGCNADIEALQQQNIEAQAEIARQGEIYDARRANTQQQIDQLKLEQLNLEKEQQRLEQLNQDLEVSNSKLNEDIVATENELERERIARKARVAKMANTYNQLVTSLEGEIQRGEVTISELKNRLTVNLVQQILFPSGSADLSTAGEKVIAQVGDILKSVDDKDIRVEGHSDNLKIRATLQEKFPSNWELSAARAANVVRFLQNNVGIPGEKLAIGAYSSYRPLADNATAEGRAQNRRIQIVLVPLEQ